MTSTYLIIARMTKNIVWIKAMLPLGRCSVVTTNQYRSLTKSFSWYVHPIYSPLTTLENSQTRYRCSYIKPIDVYKKQVKKKGREREGEREGAKQALTENKSKLTPRRRPIFGNRKVTLQRLFCWRAREQSLAFFFDLNFWRIFFLYKPSIHVVWRTPLSPTRKYRFKWLID